MVADFDTIFVWGWFPTVTLCLPLLLSFPNCAFLVSSFGLPTPTSDDARARVSVCACARVHTRVHAELLWSCPVLDCSLPGPPVHGILQARILEWAVTPSSKGSSRPRGRALRWQMCSLPSAPPPTPAPRSSFSICCKARLVVSILLTFAPL